MAQNHPPATVLAGWSNTTGTLVPFPFVCFTLALATDVAYWQTANLMWKHFSDWLLLAGLVMGALGALSGLLELLFRGAVRRRGRAWLAGILYLGVLALGILNSFIHAGDGWTGVVPYGLATSVATFVLVLITLSVGRSPAVLRVEGGGYVHG